MPRNNQVATALDGRKVLVTKTRTIEIWTKAELEAMYLKRAKRCLADPKFRDIFERLFKWKFQVTWENFLAGRGPATSRKRIAKYMKMSLVDISRMTGHMRMPLDTLFTLMMVHKLETKKSKRKLLAA
jgi:hypothetical protein